MSGEGENQVSLTESEKARIRAEEVFRSEIKAAIPDRRTPATKALEFLGQPFVLWALTITIGAVFTSLFDGLQARRDRALRIADSTRGLVTELSLRRTNGLGHAVAVIERLDAHLIAFEGLAHAYVEWVGEHPSKHPLVQYEILNSASDMGGDPPGDMGRFAWYSGANVSVPRDAPSDSHLRGAKLLVSAMKALALARDLAVLAHSQIAGSASPSFEGRSSFELLNDLQAIGHSSAPTRLVLARLAKMRESLGAVQILEGSFGFAELLVLNAVAGVVSSPEEVEPSVSASLSTAVRTVGSVRSSLPTLIEYVRALESSIKRL